MKKYKPLLLNYENTNILHYDDEDIALPNTYKYKDLEDQDIDGVLKINRLINGELVQTYSKRPSHLCCVASTRLGKTTSFVIPTILSLAKQKVKKSIIVSDPKGELYRKTASYMKEHGYNVKLLNFRDHLHSEKYNFLLPIYKRYKDYLNVEKNIHISKNNKNYACEFNNKHYDSYSELKKDIDYFSTSILDEVKNMIDTLTIRIITIKSKDDPYWEIASRTLFKSIVWAMLEDSKGDNPTITEYNFSFKTVIDIYERFVCPFVERDSSFFMKRRDDSTAKRLYLTLPYARNTVSCILSSFNEKMAPFRDVTVMRITSASTIDFQELIDKPTIIYISYKDEVKMFYDLIALFIQEAYSYLIGYATKSKLGALEHPIYFILDEFSSLPPLIDFEVAISACLGRNVIFYLIIQSLAQLENAYGSNIARIIIDNLNVHIFMGSNNMKTLEFFSSECGKITRISPLTALNGNDNELNEFNIETIPAVSISSLSCLKEGECIITEANSGYVLYSRLERYYNCEEYKNIKIVYESDYECSLDTRDPKYNYKPNLRPTFGDDD